MIPWRACQRSTPSALRLDETGARYVSEAAIVGVKGRQRRTRRFVFDAPFLLMLVRTGASLPYLAAWLETAEFLSPTTPATARAGQ